MFRLVHIVIYFLYFLCIHIFTRDSDVRIVSRKNNLDSNSLKQQEAICVNPILGRMCNIKIG